MTDGFALPSAVRNAQIFIGVIKRYDSNNQVAHYQLDDQCVQQDAFNNRMNELVTG
ncbi:MAG: hypothetical protein AAGJ67_01470 [Pseudomonadota bacterium]